MNVNDKKFYIDLNSIKRCYPSSIRTNVKNYGVLSKYENKKYTLREINAILAELIIKQPFISNSMFLEIKIMKINNMNEESYHHILSINNYEYKDQKREKAPEIKFLS